MSISIGLSIFIFATSAGTLKGNKSVVPVITFKSFRFLNGEYLYTRSPLLGSLYIILFVLKLMLGKAIFYILKISILLLLRHH